jgi:probable rRNA maturation factor
LKKNGPKSPTRGVRAAVMDLRGIPVRRPGLAGWLARVAPVRARGRVNIVLVPDARMRALNRRFRRRDAPTDVLSFPNPDSSRQNSPKLLGDIVIATGVARRQARAAGHSELAELRILALHGLLHLMGYDHHGDNGVMKRIEMRLRRKGGLREGLIERAHKQ